MSRNRTHEIFQVKLVGARLRLWVHPRLPSHRRDAWDLDVRATRVSELVESARLQNLVLNQGLVGLRATVSPTRELVELAAGRGRN